MIQPGYNTNTPQTTLFRPRGYSKTYSLICEGYLQDILKYTSQEKHYLWAKLNIFAFRLFIIDITNFIQVIHAIIVFRDYWETIGLKISPIGNIFKWISCGPKIDALRLDLNYFLTIFITKIVPTLFLLHASCFPIIFCTTASVTKRSIPAFSGKK